MCYVFNNKAGAFPPPRDAVSQHAKGRGAAAVDLFPRFDRQEPAPNAPRKTGLPRLWELVRRDFWDCFRAGLLALAGCLPFLAGMFFSVSTHTMLLAPLLGLAGGALAGPELCALADTLLRGLRDDTGRVWWHTYRAAWRRSAKASLLPGALGGGLLAAQLFLLLHAEALQVDLTVGMALVLGLLLLAGLSLYLWPQLALMELPLGRLLQNSVLLFLGRLPRTAAALAWLALYALASLRFFSFALSLLPLTNLWLPLLPALFLVYPGLEEAFQLKERFRGAPPGPGEP